MNHRQAKVSPAFLIGWMLAGLLSADSLAASQGASEWRRDPGAVALVRDGRVLWQFNYGPEATKPFFYPLNLADGTPLARHEPRSSDHPWHRGLWFSFKDINETNYWQENKATLRSDGVSEVTAAEIVTHPDFSADFRLKLAYHEPDGPPLILESRHIHVSAPDSEGSYRIDWQGSFEAQQDLHLRRTPLPHQPDGRNHGGYAGLGFRFLPERASWEFQGSDSPERGQELHGKRNRWVYLGGTEGGAAIFDHPDNAAGQPTRWWIGQAAPFMGPAFIFDEDRPVGRGETFTLRYRIAVYAGAQSPDRIDRDFRAYAANQIDLVALGRRLFQEQGCAQCHAWSNADTAVYAGPNVFGLMGATPRLRTVIQDGRRSEVLADFDYIRRAVQTPDAEIAVRESGSEAGTPYLPIMPPYPGLSMQEIRALTAYLSTLNERDLQGPAVVWAPLQGEGRRVGPDFDPELLVGDRARVVRLPLSGTSTRAIHTGFPGGANYSFDPATMSIKRIWWGGFLSAKAAQVDRGMGLNELGEGAVEWPDAADFLLPLDRSGSPVDFSMKDWLQPAGAQSALREYREIESIDAAFLGYVTAADGSPEFRFRIGEIEYRQRTSLAEGGWVTIAFRTSGANERLTFRLRRDRLTDVKASGGRFEGDRWIVPPGEADAFSLRVRLKGVPEKPQAQARREDRRAQPLRWEPAEKSAAVPAGYRVETASLPLDLFGREQLFEPLGIEFAEGGDALVTTRTAGLWRIADGQWSFYGEGFYDSLGLQLEDSRGASVVVGHKAEITRVRDRDGDGLADEFETVSDRWRLSGNYSEFVHGPVRDAEGNYFFTLNLAHGGFTAGGRHMGTYGGFAGWLARVSAGGGFEPWAPGLRSPAGIGIGPEGMLLITENQGSFVGTSKLFAGRPGAYYGHPSSLVDDPRFGRPLPSWQELDAMKEQPLVYLPQNLVASSPGNPEWVRAAGRFGPFDGQILVGCQKLSLVSRVDLEEVRGTWQGCVVPFIGGFLSGAMHLKFAPDGSLWVGQTGRGWASRGGNVHALQRVVRDGEQEPFEILTARLAPEGFRVILTGAVNPQTLSAAGIVVESWYYIDSELYGSERHDLTRHEVLRVALDEDGRAVNLAVAGMKPGRIYSIRLNDIRAENGLAPAHPVAYYTAHVLLSL